MEQRALGSSGLEVPVVGMGTGGPSTLQAPSGGPARIVQCASGMAQIFRFVADAAMPNACSGTRFYTIAAMRS